MTVAMGLSVIFRNSAATVRALSIPVMVSTRMQEASPSISVQLTTA